MEGIETFYTSVCFIDAIIMENLPFQLVYFMTNISISYYRLGFPAMAPYDAIHVGAAAPQIPDAVRIQIFKHLALTLRQQETSENIANHHH